MGSRSAQGCGFTEQEDVWFASRKPYKRWIQMKCTCKVFFQIVLLVIAISQVSALNAQPPGEREVLSGTKLFQGFDIGVNTSAGRTDWLSQDAGAMKMAYPAGQSWGAVFVTVGKPTNQERKSLDLSGFTALIIEMRGTPGATVDVGIKDNKQPDDGSEIKVSVPLSSDYRVHTIPLSKFSGANLRRLYVTAEFVFNNPQAETIWVRRIAYVTKAAVDK